MRNSKYIIFALCSLLLVFAGCKSKKHVVTETIEPEPEVIIPEEPAWHTCLIQGARAVVYTEDDKISATITMQTVRDSMLTISVMPMLGIEMARLEATPMELIAFDKIHGRYAEATFAELNRKLVPSLNWDELQQICTGELPTGEEKARLMYTFGEETIEIVITYSPRQLDVPVRVMNINKNKYTKVDISRWL